MKPAKRDDKTECKVRFFQDPALKTLAKGEEAAQSDTAYVMPHREETKTGPGTREIGVSEDGQTYLKVLGVALKEKNLP